MLLAAAVYKAAAVKCCRTDAVVWGSAFTQWARSAVKYWVRYKSNSTDLAMVRILNVAEKNDAAKSLSDIMSAGRYTKVIVLCSFNFLFARSTSLRMESGIFC